jgi:hypothetical protein
MASISRTNGGSGDVEDSTWTPSERDFRSYQGLQSLSKTWVVRKVSGLPEHLVRMLTGMHESPTPPKQINVRDRPSSDPKRTSSER